MQQNMVQSPILRKGVGDTLRNNAYPVHVADFWVRAEWSILKYVNMDAYATQECQLVLACYESSYITLLSHRY
jgi:hypothetical protein